MEKGFRLVVMVKFLKIEHCYNQWYFCGLSFGNQVAKNYQEMEKRKKKMQQKCSSSQNLQMEETGMAEVCLVIPERNWDGNWI